ncbi:3-dehydroquinate synthase [Robertkochia aurantiaca]|uniref:3-dehydroquinate synthase n=1 Tax=Robertkochia aurantiaca TaxID=2873700 RepID=UPI001CCDCF1E|nr:3-dehydroquinate synthase [Robertkochia sp. 3YJGBD-33]
MLKPIDAGTYHVFFNEDIYAELSSLLSAKRYSGLFVLVDENTHEHCLSYFLARLQTELPVEVIEIPAGEENKQLETCAGVWQSLSDLGADRKSVMINLGGGVVTDLGGFVAATYMRGIDFINIPTSLLAMVDASVGGKTGVDLGGLKNQVGVILDPLSVLVDVNYLETLPQEQLRSGLAEMLKHGLIKDPAYWETLCQMNKLTTDDLAGLIHHSVTLKNEVVKEDPRESGLRKILNFGHTLGHAIETYFLESKDLNTLLHGEAVAIGMITEAFLSNEICGLPQARLEEITRVITDYFGKTEIPEAAYPEILNLLRFDKKNEKGKINFVLLEEIGKPVLDRTADKDLIIKSLEYYNN